MEIWPNEVCDSKEFVLTMVQRDISLQGVQSQEKRESTLEEELG